MSNKNPKAENSTSVGNSTKSLISRRNLRYRLHYLIRKEGFYLITKNRTVYHDHDKPIPASKNLDRLIKEFGYCVQLHIGD